MPKKGMRLYAIAVAVLISALLFARGQDLYLLKALPAISSFAVGIAVTPDNSKVAGAMYDGLIRVWNVLDGSLIHTLSGHTNSVLCVAISIDGTKIVSGSYDTTAKIWNISDGSLIRTLGHSNYVTTVTITPDDTKIVTGCRDTTVKVWDISNGNLLMTLTGHSNSVWSVCVTSDGSKIISGSGDKSIKIWNASNGDLINTITGHTQSISGVAVTPDSSKIVSSSGDLSIKIWKLSDGSLLKTLTGHTSWIEFLTMTPDGLRIVSGGDDSTVKIWSLAYGTLLRTLTGHSSDIYAGKVFPNGLYVASGSYDNTIRIWNPPELIPQEVSVPTSKSDNFGLQVAIQRGIAVISAPYCIDPTSTTTCDGGRIYSFKNDSNGNWFNHKSIRNPFHNRENKFGLTMQLNDYYLIVSAPDSNYISTDIGIVLFYKWDDAVDNFVKDSIIRYRKTNKNYDLGSSISNINSVTAIGMPEYDESSAVTNSGSAHIYLKQESGLWGQRATITPPTPASDDHFGQCVSLQSVTRLGVSNNPSSASSQAVFIYDFVDGAWTLIQSLSDNTKVGFGWAINFMGGELYVSAVSDASDVANGGSIVVYEVNSSGQYVVGGSVKPGTIVADKHFGFSFSFSRDGEKLVVGAKPCDNRQACNIRGSVHVFTKSGDDWAELYSLLSPVADGSDGYGFDVAAEGDVVMVSAPFDASGPVKGKAYFIRK